MKGMIEKDCLYGLNKNPNDRSYLELTFFTKTRTIECRPDKNCSEIKKRKLKRLFSLSITVKSSAREENPTKGNWRNQNLKKDREQNKKVTFHHLYPFIIIGLIKSTA
jgi:hypothetical protein